MLSRFISRRVSVLPTGLILTLALACNLPAQAQITLIHAAQGYTLNQQRQLQQFDSFAFDAQGQILALGKLAEVERSLGAQAAQAKRVNLQGKTVLPGLIDAHGHVFAQGQQEQALQLRSATSLEDALQKIAQHAKQYSQAAWITGGGWNQANWKLGRFPTARELDRVSGSKPALLYRVDGHAAWANSRALALAGINAATPDPVGGKIERDAQGHPTGILIDKAMNLIKAPEADEASLRSALAAGLQTLLSLGITGVHDAGVGQVQDKLYRELGAAGKLPLRIYGMVRAGDGKAAAQFLAQGPQHGLYQDYYSLRAVKMFADGALGSRGAALLAPYADAAPQQGLLFMQDAALKAQMKQFMQAGFQVNVHAIGDAANAQVLRLHGQLQQEMPASRAQRHRIEHAQVIALADIPKFAELGVIASVQPLHATSDMNMAEARVGSERILGAYAWRRLKISGAHLACGSDFPVEEPNPWLGIHAAVTRQDSDGLPLGGWYANEALSLKETLACFTIDAAYAAHQEKRTGTLEVGKYADFIVVDQDIFKTSPYELWKVKVLQTWVGGQRRYAVGGA